MLEDYYWLVFRSIKIPPHVKDWCFDSKENYNSYMHWLYLEITKKRTGSYPSIEERGLTVARTADDIHADGVFLSNIRDLLSVSTKTFIYASEFVLEFYESPLWGEMDKKDVVCKFLAIHPTLYDIIQERKDEGHINPYEKDMNFNFRITTERYLDVCMPADAEQKYIFKRVKPIFEEAAKKFGLFYNKDIPKFVGIK
jgi:hypothetical protein